MLYEYIEKVKSRIIDTKSDLYIAALIFLVGMASFGLGRLSVLWPTKEPITIESQTNADYTQTNAENKQTGAGVILRESASGPRESALGKYIASKNGMAYHFPWCPGAQRIKEENKVWFQSKEEAEKAGYKPAGNCEGL